MCLMAERHTVVSASSMCSSNSGSDAGSISEEQKIESEVSSLSLTVVETSSSPKQDVAAAKPPVTSESCSFLREDQPSASVHAITQQIPIAMPRKLLRQSVTDFERTTISATLKPSSVDEFHEVIIVCFSLCTSICSRKIFHEQLHYGVHNVCLKN